MAPRNASTNSDDGLRTYQWRGRPLLSVTSLRKAIGIPFDLHSWIVAQNIDAALVMSSEGTLPAIDLDEFKAAKAKGDSKSKKYLADVRRPVRAAADVERDASADLGTRVHQAAEQRQTVADADPEVRPFLRQFYAAERALDMETLLSESQVFNLTAGYAGSLDILGRITNPVTQERMLALIDIKTGKGTYVDHLAQTLLYAHGEFVGQDDVIDQPATDLLHQAQAVGILHLRPEHWEWLELASPDHAKEAIFHLAALANWMNQNPSIEPFIASRAKGEA